MFAVPGWSVKAPLKKQVEDPTKEQGKQKNLKRKRKTPQTTTVPAVPAVTSTNVEELWGQHIDKNQSDKPDQKSKKIKKVKEKVNRKSQKAESSDNHQSKSPHKPQNGSKPPSISKTPQAQAQAAPPQPTAPRPVATQNVAAPPTGGKLTKLQSAMTSKLSSARFRYLNEHLYTHPSVSSLDLFSSSPDLFPAYHAGFRNQVAKWPENPVTSFLRDVKHRGISLSLPFRSSDDGKLCTLVDLGCGEAPLAAGLVGKKREKVAETGWRGQIGSVGIVVHSFDLVAANDLISVADISNLPLAATSADIAVFCLALMGSNWPTFVDEAWRVLRGGGELWVAEIKSRFPRVGGVGGLAPGRTKIGDKKKPEKGKQQQEDENEAILADEIDNDGANGGKETTDVQPFIDILRAHGFSLASEKHGANVDLKNRMFVKMRFLKTHSPSRGKNIGATVEGNVGKKKWEQPLGTKGNTTKFIETTKEEDMNEEQEAKILKPCVYKLR
jgi:ribosomal RNA-processing protein 8